jgi:hypothetical protein
LDKKIFLLIVVFLQFIVLLGCEKEEKTSLDIFVDEFKEVYPEGYHLKMVGMRLACLLHCINFILVKEMFLLYFLMVN